MISVRPVLTAEEEQTLAALAHTIWHEYFPAIIGEAQTAYMVEKFQSLPAIRTQMKNGYRYFLLCVGGVPVGYTGVHAEEDGRLFLSKLYVKKEFRGCGLSSAAIAYLKELCKAENLSAIWLTVNRHNAHTIDVYRHFGFETVREQVADIGNGYVMDDYVMELTLS